jgi:hypothetical protein
MSFSSVRRNAAQRIVQAEVQMSLIENRNPAITVLELPKINYSDNPTRQNPPNPNPGRPKEQNFIEWTDVAATGQFAPSTTPTSTAVNG